MSTEQVLNNIIKEIEAMKSRPELLRGKECAYFSGGLNAAIKIIERHRDGSKDKGSHSA